jgi:hypothetical protein
MCKEVKDVRSTTIWKLHPLIIICINYIDLVRVALQHAVHHSSELKCLCAPWNSSVYTVSTGPCRARPLEHLRAGLILKQRNVPESVHNALFCLARAHSFEASTCSREQLVRSYVHTVPMQCEAHQLAK